ncbi:uncharacterized protein PHALS_08225 [Plasmopara halstedii]|uniref:Uncharacterized protein n=1 Tax=Plasmopara halstedii TaxID=4781 RepID=A0A0P1ABL1_PLAHL|nr:uncharacterized protein PHALS_08225 [Plasmopara halstedii]CEG38135.1 hypothetical protein PHALS_08225 [Plasmopara halstedii]|eukprot:XP_024574504.1 hypothetical protein PHALS_08225 [Plasmopara halstedii]
MNDDIISLTAERLQYGLFRRWWGKKTTPSEVEKLLMGEDEVLDDVHIEAFVRYFVLYSKAAFASLIKEPSSALLLNDREIAIFHKFLHYPGLKSHLNLDDIFEKYCQGAAFDSKVHHFYEDIIESVKHQWIDGVHPANVQQFLAELTANKIDFFICEVLGRYTLLYKKIVSAVMKNEEIPVEPKPFVPKRPRIRTGLTLGEQEQLVPKHPRISTELTLGNARSKRRRLIEDKPADFSP